MGSVRAGAAVAGVMTSMLALAACSSPAAQDVVPRQLSVGECIDFGSYVTSANGAVGGDGTSSLPQVDCGEAHDGEVYAVSTATDDAFDSDALIAEVDTLCYDSFEEYVGTPFADSSLYYSIVYPTGSTWNQGDRMLACVLVAKQQTTGSLKGSGL
ncbi:septum formation family protein [Demequina capsici]|uniref:Septum formation family protein n=1 Tax=Demequina capsici TaxID=3075620 RepID=A0AA96JAQ5_9MICO|nr:septum formation family protein [Demequina sp. PMTSA13]WNM27615.1 septum formation family protein [Demequina sp. PMTSA13]